MLKNILANLTPRPEDMKFVGELKEIYHALENGQINLDKFLDMMAAKEADAGLIEQYAYKDLPKPPQVYIDFKVMSHEQKRKARTQIMESDEVQFYLNDLNRVVNENIASIHWLDEHTDRYTKMGAVEAAQRCRNVLQSHMKHQSVPQASAPQETVSWDEAERRYGT